MKDLKELGIELNLEHYLKCIAFLGREPRHCNYCYYTAADIEYLDNESILEKYYIDLSNIEKLGSHWNLKIKIIDNKKHIIHVKGYNE